MISFWNPVFSQLHILLMCQKIRSLRWHGLILESCSITAPRVGNVSAVMHKREFDRAWHITRAARTRHRSDFDFASCFHPACKSLTVSAIPVSDGIAFVISNVRAVDACTRTEKDTLCLCQHVVMKTCWQQFSIQFSRSQ